MQGGNNRARGIDTLSTGVGAGTDAAGDASGELDASGGARARALAVGLLAEEGR